MRRTLGERTKKFRRRTVAKLQASVLIEDQGGIRQAVEPIGQYLTQIADQRKRAAELPESVFH